MATPLINLAQHSLNVSIESPLKGLVKKLNLPIGLRLELFFHLVLALRAFSKCIPPQCYANVFICPASEMSQ